MSIQVLVKAELLGTPISGMFNKEDSITHETFKTKNNKPLVYSATTTLVYGAPEEPVQKGLTEVLSELSFGFVTEADIKSRLPEKVFTFLKNTTVSIKTVYYFKKANATDQAKGDFADTTVGEIKKELGLFLDQSNDEDKQASKEFDKKNEYAFHIAISLDEETQKEFPLKVSSLEFKIWKTQNQQILDRMGITEMNKLLRGAGVDVPAIANE